MPLVTAIPRGQSNGEENTEFIDTVGITGTTYRFPSTQKKLKMTNKGFVSLQVTVNGATSTLAPAQSKEFYGDINSFVVASTGGVQPFEVVGTSYKDDATNTTRRVTTKHRALVCAPNIEDYAFTAVERLNTHGIAVECTNLVMFTQNVNEWKHQFDIFVFPYEVTILPYTTPVTAAEVKTAIQTWMSNGNKVIYLTATSTHTISKLRADGTTAESVPLNDVFPVTIVGRAFTGTGTFQHESTYPFGTDEILLSGFVPNGQVRDFTSTDGSLVAIKAVEGATKANCVMFKEGSYALVGYGGAIGGVTALPGYRYIDIGVIARYLLGDRSGAKLAFDCKHNRRMAAFGIDGDVTTEPSAMQVIIDAFAKRPLEIGLVSSKVTEDLAAQYRSQMGQIEYISHSHVHSTRSTATDELYTVPTNQVVTLKRPYRVANTDISSVKTQDNVTTFTYKGVFNSNPAVGQYGYDFHGRLIFNAADVGKQIKITYTYDDEVNEWIKSLDILKGFGILSNRSIYLTGQEYSVHPKTFMLAMREGITLCDHYVAQNRRSEYILYANAVPKMVPLFVPTLKQGEGQPGFDGTVWPATKADAKATKMPQLMQRCKDLNQPYVFYSHDFITSQTDTRGLWAGSSYNADWKKAAYQDSMEYAKEMLQWIIDTFDAENVYWTYRSDYSRWYEALSQNIRYSVERSGSVTDMYVENAGDKRLEGVTFREKRSSSPGSVRALPHADLPYVYESGEVRFCVDLAPGQSVLIRIAD